MKLPIYYYDIVDHPMLQEIKEVNKNNLDTPIMLYYDLSKLIGKEVKHFKRDIVNDEDRFRYIYRIKDFVLDANEPSKILVIYSTVYPDYICENKTWARELNDFFSKVDKEKYPYSKEEYRFTRLLDIDLNITNDTINEKRMKRKIKWKWLKDNNDEPNIEEEDKNDK